MRKVVVSIFFFFNVANFYGQDSITSKDAGEIRYRAELLINQYRDLLNIISNTQTDIKETKDLIVNSYGESKNRIFKDSAIFIEDDLNSSGRNFGATKELTVASYLNNLDIFYSKSDTPSISFTNLHVSPVKKGEYFYVKVYFTSYFGGKNSLNDGAYNSQERVAEVAVEKKGGKWTGAIMHIGFNAKNLDVATDTLNNIKLFASYIETSESLNDGTHNSSETKNKSVEETILDNERLKQVEEFKKEKKAYEQLIVKGDDYFKNGDYASASKTFSEAQELQPYELYPKLKLGQIRKQVEQASLSATELYNQFIKKAQLAEAERKYELAKQYYTNAFTQKPEEASKYADQLKSLNNKIRILSELSEKYISGLYKEAVKDYDAAIKKDNQNSDYFLGRGKCYDKLAEYSKALKDYTKSIELDNNNLEALQARANLYKRQNEFFKALTDYKFYLTVDKNNLDIYTEISDLHVLTNNMKAAVEDLDNALAINAKAAFIYHKKGLLFLDLNDLIASTKNFDIAIGLDSNATLSYYFRGEANVKMKKIADAALDFAIARKKGLDSFRIGNIERVAREYFERAQQYQFSRVTDSAILYVSNAILLHPYTDLYRFFRGEYYYSTNKFEKAIENYNQAIEIQSKNQSAHYKKAMAFYQLGEFKPALESFSIATKLNGQDYLAFKGLGDANFKLSRFSDAISAYETSITLIGNSKSKIDPIFFAGIYNQLGLSYNITENYSNALQNLKVAVKLNKDFAEAYFNRGFANYKSNSLNDAIDDLTKAISYEKRPLWNYTLGDVYAVKLEFANAAQAYTEAILRDSSNAFDDVFYKRGQCMYRLQQYESALPDYTYCQEQKVDVAKDFDVELGNIYLNVAKYDSAILVFNKQLLKDSLSVSALLGIGSSHFLKGNVDESLIWFEKLFQNKTFNYALIKKSKLLGGLRDNKKFKALTKKFNL